MRHRCFRIVWPVLITLTALLAVAAVCPPGNAIKKMSSTMAAFKEAQPLNPAVLKACGALLSKDGKKLQVCLSNGDFAIPAMADSFVLPLKSKGQFILQLNFSNGNDPMKPGKFTPAAGYGKPFWVTAEVKVFVGAKGTIVMLGVGEGTAEIVSLNDTTVCGTFHLKTKAGQSFASEVAGTFNTKVERSRW